ncbi:M20 family metallopeptidase [Spongiactinospora sp. 9N601]|uniref:M20 family metallopeptidase n=1 Tax=Spongiactinospora sp. 9N601 TaxID=3375149 RepID=UPI0037B26D2B
MTGHVSAERVTALTAELVRVDTQNPPGREAAIVPSVVEALESSGCETRIFRAPSGRPSVLARYACGRPGAPTLLFNGHLDVVPVAAADWSVPPFGGIVRDGRVVGRGAADMKGGIAAAIEGLRACQDAGLPLAADVEFHLVADEETGGAHGTEALLAAGLIHADACIVPEPTELRVAVAERGSFQARIEVTGEAGHGGEPGRSRSAIADAARLVRALHLATFHDEDHPLLGRPSCNVSMIQGGLAANVVAPHCEFVIDRRSLPGETADDVLRSVLRKARETCPDVDFTVRPTFFCEASELPLPHPFADLLLDAAGRDAGPVGLSLGTDARFLRNRLGIPTVVYGPGSMRQAHAVDEWVSVTDLTAAARTYAKVIASFGRRPATVSREVAPAQGE